VQSYSEGNGRTGELHYPAIIGRLFLTAQCPAIIARIFFISRREPRAFSLLVVELADAQDVGGVYSDEHL
jgi:hypothetical protein